MRGRELSVRLSPGKIWVTGNRPLAAPAKEEDRGVPPKDTPKYPRMEWTPERVARFWDYEAQFPERYFTHAHGAAMISRLESHLQGSARVLDYACGPGHLTAHLLDRGYYHTVCLLVDF